MSWFRSSPPQPQKQPHGVAWALLSVFAPPDLRPQQQQPQRPRAGSRVPASPLLERVRDALRGHPTLRHAVVIACSSAVEVAVAGHALSHASFSAQSGTFERSPLRVYRGVAKHCALAAAHSFASAVQRDAAQRVVADVIGAAADVLVYPAIESAVFGGASSQISAARTALLGDEAFALGACWALYAASAVATQASRASLVERGAAEAIVYAAAAVATRPLTRARARSTKAKWMFWGACARVGRAVESPIVVRAVYRALDSLI
eukprot:m51a1_g665 hypothetical protein (263) ;mRNA; r:239843-240869